MTTGAAAGVDVGGTKVLAMLVAAGGEVLGERQVETPASGEGLLDAVAGLAADLFSAHPQAPAGGAVGIGMPGLVDHDGVLRYAPHLPGVVNLDVVGGVRRRLAAAGHGGTGAVVVDNDATCAGAAEHAYGEARGVDDAILVTLGTGVGGALVAGGRIVRGASNFAGEIGHMVVDVDGPPCSCGARGCWEVFAAGSALGRLAREAAAAGRAGKIVERAGGEVASVQGEHVVEAALAGDGEASELLEEYGGWVALGLASIANLLDPRLIVLGGGIVRAGAAVLEPIRQAFAAAVEGSAYRPVIPIVPARLGSEAGAVGAAVLAMAAGG